MSVASRSSAAGWPPLTVLRMVGVPAVFVALGLWMSLSSGAGVAATILVLVLALLAPAAVIGLFVLTRQWWVMVVGLIAAAIVGIVACDAIDSPTVAVWITGFVAGCSIGFDVANRAWDLSHPAAKGRTPRAGR